MTPQLLSIYRRLLTAFPSEFREEYAEEMVGVLADMLHGRSRPAQLRVFAAAVADLGVAVPAEHRASAVASRPTPEPVGTVGSPSPPTTRRTPPPGTTRREFLRGAMGLTVGAMGAGVATAGVAYLWPRSGAGFGSVVDVGSLEEVRSAIDAGGGTHPVPTARAYLVAYDPAEDPDGDYADLAGGSGFLALYQKCVHLGCRVPWCTSSTWFECPCHGSQYNRWGEYQTGPAPRGLDRFRIEVADGRVLVDTRTVVTGPARSVDVLDELPAGPHCVREA